MGRSELPEVPLRRIFRTTSSTNRIASNDPTAADAPTVFQVFEDDISLSPAGTPRLDSPPDILSISRGVPKSNTVGEELGTNLEGSIGAKDWVGLGTSLNTVKDARLGKLLGDMLGIGLALGASLTVRLEAILRTTDGSILLTCLGVVDETGLLLGFDTCGIKLCT